MNKELNIPGREIFKWSLFGISAYLNFTVLLSIFFGLISLLLRFIQIQVNLLIVFDIAFLFIKLGLIILALVLIYRRTKNRSITKFPRGLALASFICLPIIIVVQYTVQSGGTVVLARFHGAEYLGKYSMFNSVFYVVASFLTLVTLMIFGIIASSRK